MKNLSRLMLAALLAAATSFAQEPILIAPGQYYYAQQAPPVPPVPPVSPAPPAPPAMPSFEAMRLMSLNGSFLGVGVRDVTEERKKALNLKEERGAEITSVEEDTPASKAGLKTADVVIDYNGNRVEGMEQFIRLVRETPAGREVKITVVRNGAPVTLAARPESGSSRMQKSMTRIRELMPEMRGFTIETMPRPAMNWESTTLGIEAEGLSEQLASFFGVKHGVLVRSVSGSSLAEKSGIKAGDVITKVDGEEVKSPRDVTSQIRAARGKSSAVAFTLTRDRKEQTLKVTFPETSERPAAPPRVRSIRNKELNL